MKNGSLPRTAFVRSLPVMAGYLVLGAGFGVLLSQAGYGPLWALGMSLTVYAGSMQFAAVGLLTGGAGLLTTALTTLMVNARHVFYGVSMLPVYRDAGKRKPLLALTLTDETYSLLCSGDIPQGVDPHAFCLWVSLLDYAYWAAGSFLGGLLGQSLPFDTTGLEFSMTALFVTVFVEQWRGTAEHRPALLGVGITLLCLLLFGSTVFLLPSMALILLSLTLLRPRLEGGAPRA